MRGRALVICVVSAGLTLLALPVPAGAARDLRIRIDAPKAYQVVQRDAAGRGVIVVRGRCSGFDGRLRVSWGPHSVGVVARRDGRFTARLETDAAGQAELRVASLSHPSLTARRQRVGVGDVYVIAGQSNAAGRGPNLSEASHPELVACLFGNDYRWKKLADPVDSPEGQVDKVSRDLLAGGSVWPLVATHLMAAGDVPVAFIPCARGNTTMRRWVRDPGRPRSRRTLYGSLVHRVRVSGGRVAAVLLLQGESDARFRVPPASYARQLRRFAADLAHDVGAPVVVGQSPDFPVTRYPPESVDAIRDVQTRAGSLGRNLRQGPSLYDIDLHGGWHLSRPADQAVAARRWAAAVLRGVLRQAVSAPPRLASAVYDGERVIELGFTGGALVTGPVQGFSVEAGGRPVAVLEAAATGEASVRLVLAGTPSGESIRVSLGRGRDGAGVSVPVETSEWRQPAPTVLGRKVDLL